MLPYGLAIHKPRRTPTLLCRDRPPDTNLTATEVRRLMIGSSPTERGKAVVTSNPEASPEAVAAVARLSQVVADPEWRRSFVADPIPALESANIVVAHIPQRLLESLQSLSEEELEVLARICPELVEAGFYVEVPDYGRVCYY